MEAARGATESSVYLGETPTAAFSLVNVILLSVEVVVKQIFLY